MNDRDRLYTHVEDGGVYHLVDDGAMLKDETTGAWVPAVIYQDAWHASDRYGQVYVTSVARWSAKFTRFGSGR